MEKQLVPKLRFPFFKNEWCTYKLKDISKVYDGTHQTPKYVSEGIPFYSVEHITANQFEKTKFISNEVFKKENKRVKLEKGDILMTRIGSIGVSKYIDWDVNASFYVSLALIKKVSNYDSRYLNQFINSDFFQKELWKRTIHVAFPIKINLGEIGECLTVFPSSLSEQQKIASFLTDVDNKITKLTKKKDLLEQYKKGIMQKIFSQALRFKDDNGNEFPKWEVKKLGSICNYKNGGSFEQYVSNEGVYNLISLNSIDINGKLKPSHKKVTINDNSLDKGDLVMVLSDVAHGYFLGLTDIVPDNTFVLNQRMGALKPKININSYFLKTYINFNQKYFKLMGQGSSQQNLSKGDILKFTVKTPIIEEQIKIANFLSDIDIKIEVLNTKIENSKAFKKGLLQQMFV